MVPSDPGVVLGGAKVVGSYLLVEPAALYHRGIDIPLNGVGPLAKVMDLLGGRAGRLSGQRRAKYSDHLRFCTSSGTNSTDSGPDRLVGLIFRTRQVELL